MGKISTRLRKEIARLGRSGVKKTFIRALLNVGRAAVNHWYDEGHQIYFFTSRTDEHRQVTEEWLNRHGFKYHGVVYNKPRGGNYHWIDNHIVKATRYKGKFTELVVESHHIEVFPD